MSPERFIAAFGCAIAALYAGDGAMRADGWWAYALTAGAVIYLYYAVKIAIKGAP